MKILVASFLLLSVTSAYTKDCWKGVLPGHHFEELRCVYEEWSLAPTRSNLMRILPPLFYVYISDGTHTSMKAFFDGMRVDDFRYHEVRSLKQRLIRKYTFDDFTLAESAAVWAMQPTDARTLFLLTQDDPESVPREITYAMYLSVYEEMERYFYLGPPYRNSTSIFPETEYLRLLEILKSMDWMKDAFLHATNLYYQSLVEMNLRRYTESRELSLKSHAILEWYLKTATQTLSRRRTLHGMAVANIMLGRVLEAEANYVSILEMDPEDWNAIMQLSYLMNRRGECQDPAIWVEASSRSNQESFEIIIHCGRQPAPDEEFPTGPQVIASFTERKLINAVILDSSESLAIRINL